MLNLSTHQKDVRALLYLKRSPACSELISRDADTLSGKTKGLIGSISRGLGGPDRGVLANVVSYARLLVLKALGSHFGQLALRDIRLMHSDDHTAGRCDSGNQTEEHADYLDRLSILSKKAIDYAWLASRVLLSLAFLLV